MSGGRILENIVFRLSIRSAGRKQFIDQVRRDGKAAYSEKCVKRVELMFEKNERYEEYLELYRWLGEK